MLKLRKPVYLFHQRHSTCIGWLVKEYETTRFIFREITEPVSEDEQYIINIICGDYLAVDNLSFNSLPPSCRGLAFLGWDEVEPFSATDV